MVAGAGLGRREFALGLGVGASLAAAGCSPAADTGHIAGGFTGVNVQRGHLLRNTSKTGALWPAPSRTLRADVIIAGGGVAGLAAARSLRQQGVEDFALLELEDSVGGNSRGGLVSGIPCPLGAHYLPVPSEHAPEIQDFLEELGLRKRIAGQWRYDETVLCHSPQERLFFNGQWQEGLLPVQDVSATTLAHYRRFSDLVEQERALAPWRLPMHDRAPAASQRALAATSFDGYLTRHGLDDAHLRWYLDYCCRDDYGAGSATVSAWAGIHYFASRHGFLAPGSDRADASGHEGVLTWPQGNAWLTGQLAKPLDRRLRTGLTVVRIADTRHGAEVDAWDNTSQTLERWIARRVIVALPVFVAARVLHTPPDFLVQAAQSTEYAPWLVANLSLAQPLQDRPGAAPAWDNVVYGANGLGYVDATHQSLKPIPGSTVLTHYRALGQGQKADRLASRRALLERPWSAWRDAIVGELSAVHPDLVAKARQLEVTRYGHAMAIPVPRKDGQIAPESPRNVRKQLSKQEHYPTRPVPVWHNISFAHSDWAGYSVFEEAFALGHAAGQLGW